MLTNMFIVQAGLVAGIVMGMFAMIMHMLNLTTLNLTKYMGCMLTNKKSGPVSFLAGFGAHLVASVIFSFIYLHIIKYFSMGLTLKTGIILGVVHTIFSGLMLATMDSMNACVAQKKVKAMKIFAQGHGIMGMIVFATVHIIYAVVLIKMFTIGSLLMLMNIFSIASSQKMTPPQV